MNGARVILGMRPRAAWKLYVYLLKSLTSFEVKAQLRRGLGGAWLEFGQERIFVRLNKVLVLGRHVSVWWLLAVMFPGPSDRAFCFFIMVVSCSTLVPGGQNLCLTVVQGPAWRAESGPGWCRAWGQGKR